MKKTNRKQRGITLIALIITIIVMLILVGVSVTNTYYCYEPESQTGYTAPTGLINIGTTY